MTNVNETRDKPRARELLREKVERELSGARAYRVQRAYVAIMFDVMGRLIEASSEADAEVAEEVLGFPEDYVIGFSVLGDTLAMRVKKQERKLVRMPSDTKPTLEITFKHLSHAFNVLSFQESTAQAFANDRAITQGDIALAMRFVRCLNRMQLIALPGPISRRALKAPLPALAVTERALLTAKLYGRVTSGLTRRNTP